MATSHAMVPSDSRGLFGKPVVWRSEDCTEALALTAHGPIGTSRPRDARSAGGRSIRTSLESPASAGSVRRIRIWSRARHEGPLGRPHHGSDDSRLPRPLRYRSHYHEWEDGARLSMKAHSNLWWFAVGWSAGIWTIASILILGVLFH